LKILLYTCNSFIIVSKLVIVPILFICFSMKEAYYIHVLVYIVSVVIKNTLFAICSKSTNLTWRTWFLNKYIVTFSFSVASKKSKCNTLSEGNKTKINYSYSGKLCQNWSNLTNNALIHFNKTFDRRKEVLKKNSTLCQDPYRSGIMGCYVNDSVSTWEPCFFSRTPLLLLNGV
jgi:hypothetical protein